MSTFVLLSTAVTLLLIVLVLGLTAPPREPGDRVPTFRDECEDVFIRLRAAAQSLAGWWRRLRR